MDSEALPIGTWSGALDHRLSAVAARRSSGCIHRGEAVVEEWAHCDPVDHPAGARRTRDQRCFLAALRQTL